ncbi:MAG: PH domain-containing protein [Candidatus Pacebacteria bacterium]|nr:PH domain-containing protein [Candidatus Paceibacterota bacterium]
MITDKIELSHDEHVLTLTRKHWFILFVQLLEVLGIALLPLILVLVVAHMVPDLFTTLLQHYTPVLLYGACVWILLSWMVGFNIWTNYYLDIWIVTNKRLVAVDQEGLFRRSMGSFRLERLQDLNVEVHGILATFLRYGTLEAQTAAGSKEEFRATGLPHPRALKSLILKAADVRMDDNNASDESGA